MSLPEDYEKIRKLMIDHNKNIMKLQDNFAKNLIKEYKLKDVGIYDIVDIIDSEHEDYNFDQILKELKEGIQ